MSTRLKLKDYDLPGYRGLVGLEQHLATTGLTQVHKDLIYIRASQLNGCSYCIDKHSLDARAHGETERRIYALNAWRETPFFTPEERAILALTEEMTLIHRNHVTDATYDQAAALLGDQYLSSVILCILSINAWNRLGISTGMQPAAP